MADPGVGARFTEHVFNGLLAALSSGTATEEAVRTARGRLARFITSALRLSADKQHLLRSQLEADAARYALAITAAETEIAQLRARLGLALAPAHSVGDGGGSGGSAGHGSGPGDVSAAGVATGVSASPAFSLTARSGAAVVGATAAVAATVAGGRSGLGRRGGGTRTATDTGRDVIGGADAAAAADGGRGAAFASSSPAAAPAAGPSRRWQSSQATGGDMRPPPIAAGMGFTSAPGATPASAAGAQGGGLRGGPVGSPTRTTDVLAELQSLLALPAPGVGMDAPLGKATGSGGGAGNGGNGGMRPPGALAVGGSRR